MDNVVYLDHKAKELENLISGKKTIMNTIMKKNRLIILVLLFIFGIHTACAQNTTPADYFENVSGEKIYSDILKEQRTIYVSLPKNYSKSTKYPVLYLLDGEMIEPFKEAFQCIKKNHKIGQPLETKVKGRIIKGWTEILKVMPVGSKYMVYIPTELGYGTQVRPGGVIEANMALIFEMELLEIVAPKK